MKQSLLFSIAEGVLWKIASRTLHEAATIYGIENQISELRETLTAIKAVLLDAEEQQAKNHRLQVWLDRLQDVFYDAEDVLDELECEALRKQVLSRYGGIYGKSNVFGRDLDRKKIIELLQPTDDKNLSVIPIVGIGGLGKTTVAKLVYNYDNVKEQFELRIWVWNYLLVLDDVWSNNHRKWNELRALLSVGASESKIIVTMRSSEVASVMSTCLVHNLKGLSHEDSIALFKKWAFDEKEEELCPKLLEIGNDIDINQEHNLADLWMAFGLISSTRNKLALEDVGVEYVKELWKRSLIQEVEGHESILAFKVHGIVHSLAMSVAQNDCSIVGLDTTEISERIRYVSLSSSSLKGISNFNGRLRAIKLQFKITNGVITKEFSKICISKCNSLRYLDLPFGSFDELPSSICNLKQLRMLSLQYNKQLKKLPNTICELQSLLYLSLIGCSELGHLPKNMKRLINLRYLYITTKQKSLQERLACTLETFCVYDCPSLTVVPEWLPNHTYLRLIRLIRCPNVSSMPQGIGGLIALKESHIVHCGELSKRCEPETSKDWHKIAHVPRIKVDQKRVQWTDD
ncbi:hypothetical protein EUGRSUZ_K01751 [Eucalyptus grandis]|uniref:Rx N-terminal domain-containing protein n=2 Tax=Eucalyptus grandis TaxID=71139 RepID=A0A059A2R5_EUCGR|nr:hypothetical protein EUGRSUZ_K01751 [Eucalyptus grandis]